MPSFELLNALSGVGRFEMNLMFLSRVEKIALIDIFSGMHALGINVLELSKKYGIKGY